MDEHSGPNRPRWLTDELLEQAVRTFRPKSSLPFGEAEAIALLLLLSQLLEVTGILKVENEHANEETVHRLGEG